MTDAEVRTAYLDWHVRGRPADAAFGLGAALVAAGYAWLGEVVAHRAVERMVSATAWLSTPNGLAH